MDLRNHDFNASINDILQRILSAMINTISQSIYVVLFYLTALYVQPKEKRLRYWQQLQLSFLTTFTVVITDNIYSCQEVKTYCNRYLRNKVTRQFTYLIRVVSFGDAVLLGYAWVHMQSHNQEFLMKVWVSFLLGILRLYCSAWDWMTLQCDSS